MSEIIKLYENAGVKLLPTCNNCKMLDEYWSNGTYCSTCKCDKDNDECNMASYQYPPFTAEKQIELIKWIAKTRPIHITFLIDKWVIEGMVRYGKRYDTFEDALSGYINSIWKDLSEEEKQQVKGILEE